MYSGLNFHKRTLLKQYKCLELSKLRTLLSKTPENYFTDQEKSDHIISRIFSKHVPILVSAGWKVFDTLENREKCKDDIEIYNAIPKY